jgi:SAM-dependent methyltransferase
LFEYQALFDARGGLYNRANRLYPEARAQEASAMIRHLSLSPRSRWLDVSAGGGYLSDRARAEGLPRAWLACDASLPFLISAENRRGVCVARAEMLPLSAGRFDAAVCLAALHHSEDPRSVVRELLRVTVSGGRAALGDVADGSPAARFLNGFADRHTPSGHRGRFYAHETLAGFFGAEGARGIRGERLQFDWNLPSRADAALFFRDLFGLTPATTDAEISDALGELGAGPSEASYRIPWTMNYVSGCPA